ncbi:MAG: biotin transporter BioY [Clostridiales bacterium]|nr:biotin transporter BioY [Clostridiales bacterium]
MKKKITTRELTTMALLAALLCVSSYISIQLPISAVPITAQTLVINMIALLLKPKKAPIPVAVWLLLGLVGLPVFSGGRGGIGVVAGATGGYILSYVLVVFVISLIRGQKNKVWRNLIAVFVGEFVIYAVGIPWMKVVMGIGWKAAIVSGMLPFLIGDVIKCIVAVYICKPLYRVVNYEEFNSAVPSDKKCEKSEESSPGSNNSDTAD